MAIGPVEMNGMISRSQDFTSLKHNENHRVVVDQTNFLQSFEKEVDERLTQVNKKDNADSSKEKFDAKEKSKNQYSGQEGKKQKNKQSEKEDKVIVKGTSHFDVHV